MSGCVKKRLHLLSSCHGSAGGSNSQSPVAWGKLADDNEIVRRALAESSPDTIRDRTNSISRWRNVLKSRHALGPGGNIGSIK